MKNTFRNSMCLALISASAAFSMTACFAPTTGEDSESTQGLDEGEQGVAAQASTISNARISYWSGKVNAHLSPTSIWIKDADCTSGAGIDPLTYCQKFYPSTISVTSVEVTKKPRSCGTRQAADSNTAVTASRSGSVILLRPRIAYWSGKVNAHLDSGGTWTKDTDCTSGAGIDPLTYCQKFYPTTTSVTSVAVSPKPALLWNTAGCGQQYSGDGVQEWTCNP